MANLNFFRGKYSDYVALKNEGNVVDTNLYFTLPMQEAILNDEKKSTSYCLFQGTNLLACSANYGDIQTALADIVGLKNDLASLEERIGKISSELATYEIKQLSGDTLAALGANVKEAYALYKITPSAEEGGQVTEELVGETVKIYKDSALQKVEMVDQKLQFTYLTASGGTEVVDVDVSKFLAESEFGNGLEVIEGVAKVKAYNGIEVSENGVAAKVADIDKNFLSVDSNGLAVTSVDTDCTVTTSDIVIAGGPLDNEETRKALSGGTDDAGNFIIKQGTDIQQLLISLFTKESYPTSFTYTSASASAAMNNLTLTLSKTGEQEVGTLVTLNAGSTNGSKVSSKRNSSIAGLTNGWSANNDNQKDSNSTTITSTIKADTVKDNTYTISATINSGFGADKVTNKKTTPTTKTGNGSAALDVTKLGCVEEGTNKITINATGASYSYSAAAITSGYVVSNVGNTSSAHTYNGVNKVDTATTKPTTSATASTTGYYKYFGGYTTYTSVDDINNAIDGEGNSMASSIIRGLTTLSGKVTKDGTTTIVGSSSKTSNGTSIIFACPSKYKLATIQNGPGASILSNFSEKGTVSVKTGEIMTTYNVYIYPITNGAKVEFKNVTLTK